MKTIGITGSQGFIGWHLRCFYKTIDDVEVICANRNTFEDENQLIHFVKQCDIIVHLAGVNRGTDEDIYTGNLEVSQALVKACVDGGVFPTILFSSSTQVEHTDNVYSKAKSGASLHFEKWAESTEGKYCELIIPHVFGEYGVPFYNSAVNTFCHQIASGEEPNITGNANLELIHVQNLCDCINNLINEEFHGKKRIIGESISVMEVAGKLKEISNQYHQGIIPDLSDPFDRALFNAYRGAIPDDKRVTQAQLHVDDRGWLVETVKATSGGQCFVSSTKPGIVRGNHFHRRKFERFFVLKGRASIKLRKLNTEDIIEYQVNAETPSYIDIPTLYTHNITNMGDEELITLFWSDEIFDPNNTDTYFEEVCDASKD